MAYVKRSTLVIDLADGHKATHAVTVEAAIEKAAEELRKLTGVTVSLSPMVTVSERKRAKG